MAQHDDRFDPPSPDRTGVRTTESPDEARQGRVVFRTPRQRRLFVLFVVVMGIAAGLVVAALV
jgi:hypothetical protein